MHEERMRKEEKKALSHLQRTELFEEGLYKSSLKFQHWCGFMKKFLIESYRLIGGPLCTHLDEVDEKMRPVPWDEILNTIDYHGKGSYGMKRLMNAIHSAATWEVVSLLEAVRPILVSACFRSSQWAELYTFVSAKVLKKEFRGYLRKIDLESRDQEGSDALNSMLSALKQAKSKLGAQWRTTMSNSLEVAVERSVHDLTKAMEEALDTESWETQDLDIGNSNMKIVYDHARSAMWKPLRLWNDQLNDLIADFERLKDLGAVSTSGRYGKRSRSVGDGKHMEHGDHQELDGLDEHGKHDEHFHLAKQISLQFL
jgi:hypothetical protein